MDIINNESLKKYTTIKIGGQADKLYFPESVQELIKLLSVFFPKDIYIIGGGSNLLINDQKVFGEVICLRKTDPSIRKINNGKYYVGASVSLQKLIDFINKEGYGGIEYLYSVPALVGGAIAMNAGRGKIFNLSISDYIIDVNVYDYNKRRQKILKKKECQFSYRNSLFKNNKIIILGATFNFDSIDIEETSKRKKERLELVKRTQDYSGYNFGSVFREYNRHIMQLIKLIHPGYKNGMSYSRKTSNWLINKGNGTYEEACVLINKIIKIHRFFGLKAIPEIIKWS